MEKITVGQFLMFTNRYVPICIEDEFNRYEGRGGSGMSAEELFHCVLTEEAKECPIDYIRNVDGGYRGDEKKVDNAIVLGIGLENWEKYFGKE